MTEKMDAPPTVNAGSTKKFGTWLVTAAILFPAVVIFYMDRLPGGLFWPVRILFAAAAGWLLYLAVRKARTTRFQAKNAVFSLILVLFLYGMLYLMCHVFIKLMAFRDERVSATAETSEELSPQARRGIQAVLDGSSPVQFDREVGWVHRPGSDWGGYHITEQGTRGFRIYDIPAPDPSRRILCVGDSFTFGYEVKDDESFPAQGEQLAPGTEWINLGICGGGPTNALMQYRKNGRRFGGKYVVIGFMTNNQKRTVNCFRPIIAPTNNMTPMTQPYAKFTGGVLTIEPNPFQDVSEYSDLLANESEVLRRLRQLDYLTWSNQQGAANPIARTWDYIKERRNVDANLDILLNRNPDNDRVKRKKRLQGDPYGKSIWDPESPGCQANLALFDLFHDEVIGDGRVPLIIVLPSALDVEQRVEGRSPAHAPLLEHLKKKGYRHFDFLDSLEKKYQGKPNPKDLYVETHFNAAANRFLAEEILKALELP